MHYFFPALGLIFITLKLLHHLDWSWWIVLLPIYGPALLALVIMIGAACVHNYLMKHNLGYALKQCAKSLGKSR